MRRSWKFIRIVALAVGLTFAAAPAVVLAQGETQTTQQQDDGFDWGWIGLLGLLGLAGLSGRNRDRDGDREVRATDRTRP